MGRTDLAGFENSWLLMKEFSYRRIVLEAFLPGAPPFLEPAANRWFEEAVVGGWWKLPVV